MYLWNIIYRDTLMEKVSDGKRRRTFLFILIIISIQFVNGQNVPFTRGINLAYWFEAESAEKVKFTQYTQDDFENIKILGCDVIRVPVHLPNITNGEPDYTVNPLFYDLFDQVVQWCDELGIYLILDNHSSGEAGTVTDPEIGTVLEKLWNQVAFHYKDASGFLLYEILNEPHDIDNDIWNIAQQEVLSAIRQIDDTHTIILSPSNWDDFRNLDSMYVYNDDNVLYTFHFYEPHLFTAQGAANSNFAVASGVPFPYSEETMPPCPAEYLGTWKEQYWQIYEYMGTVDSVKKLMDLAKDFAAERNVKIFCGEYGSFISSCPPDDRIYWYQTLRNAFEERNIPWLIWDYHSDMGIFTRGDYYGLFDHDLNIPLIEALGLNVPAQTPLTIIPDTEGYPVYQDYVNPVVRERSYTSGALNFYSTDEPFEGTYCIKWNGAAPYNSLVFGFHPVKDLSWLAEHSYFLSLWVKGNATNCSLQVRFLDTKTDDPEDHPWRMSNNITVPADNTWHKIDLPLSEFSETGSWDNGAWHNPEGKFDWSATDQLEIATEGWDMGDNTLYFDNILITNEVENGITHPAKVSEDNILIRYSEESQSLTIVSKGDGDVTFSLIDLTGRVQKTVRFRSLYTIGTQGLPDGVYILKFEAGNDCFVKKIQVN